MPDILSLLLMSCGAIILLVLFVLTHLDDKKIVKELKADNKELKDKIFHLRKYVEIRNRHLEDRQRECKEFRTYLQAKQLSSDFSQWRLYYRLPEKECHCFADVDGMKQPE